MNILWYLATPYSKYPHGIEEAFKLACRETALLIRHGVPVYSPIANMHPIAIHGEIDPYSHDIWLPVDEVFMNVATGLIVLRAESWELSYGIKQEMQHFGIRCKPIIYMEPGIVPIQFLH